MPNLALTPEDVSLADTTAFTLKALIAIKTNTEVTKFRLFMGETYLNDAAFLSDKGVSDNCVLHMSPKTKKRKQLKGIEGDVKDTDKPIVFSWLVCHVRPPHSSAPHP